MPAPKDLAVYQGDDWDFPMRLRGRAADGTLLDYIDLTGCTPKAQVRTSADDATVRAEMGAAIGNQVSSKGSVTLTLTHTQTAALDGEYVWDFQITDVAGKVRTYLAGAFRCDKQVTR